MPSLGKNVAKFSVSLRLCWIGDYFVLSAKKFVNTDARVCFTKVRMEKILIVL